jgi:SAM-dependent methyltransferase
MLFMTDADTYSKSRESAPQTNAGSLCPACGAPAAFLFRTTDTNRRLSEREFVYYRCAQCGFIFIDEPPVDLDRYYPQEYYSLPRSVEDFARDAAPEQYKVDIVRRFVSSGTVIEVGPGRGNFCYLAQQAGYDVIALERDRKCREFISTVLGVPVTRETDEVSAMEESRPADVVAMWHVLEHLPDPWRFLETAARRLNTGGILVIAVPNPHALQFKVFGKYWTHVDAPRHLCLIPPALLALKLRALGLEPVMTTTRDPGSIGWNTFGWVFSLANFFEHRLTKRAARAAGRAVSSALSWIEGREGWGAAYTAVFRKPKA